MKTKSTDWELSYRIVSLKSTGKLKLIKTENNYLLEDEKGVVVASSSLKEDGISLSLVNCLSVELGYDLDELIDKVSPKKDTKGNISERIGFFKGFQKALELMDKKFSEEDLMEAYSRGQTNSPIQSLKKTQWDVEVEMEQYCALLEIRNHEPIYSESSIIRPKLDPNGCLILKRTH